MHHHDSDSTKRQPSAAANPVDGHEAPLRHPRLTLAAIALAQFMVILDITVVNVALPEIGGDLGLERETLTWVLSAYTMALGGLLIVGGRVADAWGPRRAFLAGLLLFTSSSLTAGLAGSGEALIVSRVGQGVGAALLSPAALSILMRSFTGRARERALGVWGAIGGLGAAAGVLVGGALTSGPGWTWVFFINVPVGLVVAGVVPVLPSLAPRGERSLGVLPALLGSVAVTLGIYGLIQAGDHGWTSSQALVPGFAALVAAGLFVLAQSHSRRPLVPRGLFRGNSLAGGVLVMTTASAAMVSIFFLSSMYLQRVHSFSALETGLLFLPATLGIGLGAHAATHAVVHIGPRRTGGLGLALGALGLGGMGLGVVEQGGVDPFFVAGLVVGAIGIGLSFVTATTSGLFGIGNAEAGVASGVLTTGHEIGASVGVALVSSLASVSLAQSEVVDVSGFEQAYLWTAVATLAVALVAGVRLLPRERPAADELPMFTH